MGLEAKITNQLTNQCVQVEIGNSKSETKKYYSVPENRADEFIASYKKNDKKISFVTNTAFVSAILGGVLLTSLITRNLKSGILRWALNTMGGIAGAVASFLAGDKYIQNKQNKLMQEYQAHEIQ